MISVDSIVFVVVLYKCQLKDSLSLKTLEKSLMNCDIDKIDIVIYDNSPIYNNKEIELYPRFNITYIKDEYNSGVSKAYNLAFNIGKKYNKKYIMLLDQDTIINESFFKELLCLDDKYNLVFPKLICKGEIISPCFFRWGRAKHLNNKDVCYGTHKLKYRNFLNSGSVISIKLFERIGGFDEKLPLYYSDFNFFNRSKLVEKEYFQLSSTFIHDMSSNDNTDLQKFIRRYELYCDGALRCYNTVYGVFMMMINILLRASKLGIKYRTFDYLKISIKSIYDYFFR